MSRYYHPNSQLTDAAWQARSAELNATKNERAEKIAELRRQGRLSRAELEAEEFEKACASFTAARLERIDICDHRKEVWIRYPSENSTVAVKANHLAAAFLSRQVVRHLPQLVERVAEMQSSV